MSLADFNEDDLLDVLNEGGGGGEAKKLDTDIWVELELGTFKKGEFDSGDRFFDGTATVVDGKGSPIKGAWVDVATVVLPDRQTNRDTDSVKNNAKDCYQFFKSIHEFLDLGFTFEAKARPTTNEDGSKNWKAWEMPDGSEVDQPTATAHNNATTVSAVKACIAFREQLPDMNDEGKPVRGKVEGLTGERVFAKLKQKANGRALVRVFFKECPEDVEVIYDEDRLFVS